MNEVTLFDRATIQEILVKPKNYRKEVTKHVEDLNYTLIQKLIGKSKSNEKYERAKFSIYDKNNNEYIVILQKVIEEDFDNFSGSLYLKTAKEEIFLCRLDYNDEHLRKCKRDCFGDIRADKFHFHLHCRECYEIMGKDGLENIAFSIERTEDLIDFISFLKTFFEKIGLEIAENFVLLQMEMNYENE